MAPVLGCIADDYTGATDLSAMLVRSGMRVIQVFGARAWQRRTGESAAQSSATVSFREVDAIVVALKSRSIPSNQAVEQSLEALRFLRQLGVQRFFFKYCSTFDSTEQGNIGPVADALADELQAESVLFCPAFPENGRSVYRGHLFVGDQLLSDSGMRQHPLNPMTDSNLVRVLQAQSNRNVGYLPRNSLLPQSSHCRYWIADAIEDEDLRHVAQVAGQHLFLTGGSAIARYWAEQCWGDRLTSQRLTTQFDFSSMFSSESRAIVLAGSCSDATREQIAAFRVGYPCYEMSGDSEDVASEANAIIRWCELQWQPSMSPPQPLIVCSGATPARVQAIRDRWGTDAARRVEEIFALVARQLFDRGLQRLVVAGGETAGAVIDALEIEAIRIGPEIAPGVPWVATLAEPRRLLVLKSGNFGDREFFFKALEKPT
ncbi:MAG: four-carbon acid sugar kinase family protein [Planctomycetales bacterium]|nr:four-carbon acid sugar kinase family protein [Planctomycetales bacterium]